MRSRLPLALFVLFLMPLPAAFSQTLDDYTIFSNDSLVLRDRVKVKNGLLGSNTGMQMGYDAALTGNIKSRGNMTMLDRSLVTGNVTLGGALTRGAQSRVTGTVTQNTSVPSIAIPTVSVTIGEQDVSVAAGGMRRLTKGSYRDVVVSPGGTLYLEGGTYLLNSLNLQADATLYCDTMPSTEIMILSELKIGERVRILVSQGSLKASDVRIYSHQTAALSVATDGRIEAVLTLPRASVTLGDRTALVGGLRARGVTVGYDCPVNGAHLLDADGDLMSDTWETSNGLNPNANDANNDPDGDSLKNIDEFKLGTKPKVADTDGDGLNDGAENTYWAAHSNYIRSNSDPDNDGLPNILDPDSDNDGLLDGAELAGWTMTVRGVTKTFVGDAANPDSDFDGVIDSQERNGYAINFPNHTVHNLALAASPADQDDDGLDDSVEHEYGLNYYDPQSFGTMSDLKYYEMINHMGEWAVSPTTGHLNPHLASTAACILGAKVGFGDDNTTALIIDRQMEMSLFLPQDGLPVTIQIDFVYASGSTPDANDKFYDIKFSGAVYPEGTNGVPAMNCPTTGANSITWRITDPMYLLKGDYFVNFSYHYDKNNGEKPRQIRMYVSYDDNTRVRIQYVAPVKAGTYKSPMHFNLLVAGGAQPAYFRGETAVSSASNSYIDNVKLTDYSGNTVRTIGRKAFNGYWFQYPLGKLNSYSGGLSGLTACHRLEFDWVHDTAADQNHVSFAIDEVGNKWDDVQITYNRAYLTQDYYCWYGGVARNVAVLRRGSSIQAEATNASLQSANAQVSIKNRTGADVTTQFTIHKETGFEDYAAFDGTNATWRENWIVEALVSLPVGMYTITMRAGSWTASASFYLVINRSEMSIPDAEYAGYAYDEDTDGLTLVGETDNSVDRKSSIISIDSSTSWPSILDPQLKLVTDLGMAIVDGKTTMFSMSDAVRLFANKLIFGGWTVDNDSDMGGSPERYLKIAGVTVAEALSGNPDPAHRLYGYCYDFSGLLTCLTRAIGIPSRQTTSYGGAKEPNRSIPPDPVTGKTTPGFPWSMHSWCEAWVENPVPPVTDHWYVYDASDWMGTVWGISTSRSGYSVEWIDPSGTQIFSNDFIDPRFPINIRPYYVP